MTTLHIQRRSQGERGKFSLETGKLRGKMMLFPKALFLVTNFLKIVKNSIFLLNFHETFQNFSEIPSNLCFSYKRAKN